MTIPVATPATRQYARANGIDPMALAKELGQDTISRADVDRKRNGATTASSGNTDAGDAAFWQVDHGHYGPVTAEPMSRFARLAAANLAAAQRRIPAVTHHDRADVTALEALRKAMKPLVPARLTALAFHVKALARTLDEFPRFNAALSADGETLFLKAYVDIGIAMDTPHGLMVPAVRGADRKGITRIAAEIADLAGRAQARKVRPDEMGGAGMTISNLGGIGGQAFSPIINPPEVAILGLMRTEIVPVWDGATFVPRPMQPLDLTYDHRLIDGAAAARFLTHYAGLIADPRKLML